MKIVSWNCNGAFRHKFKAVSALDGDVFVIQECENPKLSTNDYRQWAESYVWAGSSPSKGIGVFVKNGLSISTLAWPDHGLRQFLPVRINNELNLLAVWTKDDRVNRMGYIGQFWQYIQHHTELICDQTVICGDLNSNRRWDKKGRLWNHSECVASLKARGFESLYHVCNGEQQGTESMPTFYLQRKLEKPYHIDYFFANPLLAAPNQAVVTVGSAEDWLLLSDHMPITLTI